MQEIDVILDEHPDMAMELVLLAIRNQNAHRELVSYSESEAFIHVHELTIRNNFQKTEREKLIELKKTDPDAFIVAISNATQNVRRIASGIKKKKYKDEAELLSWEKNLEKAKIRREIMMEII